MESNLPIFFASRAKRNLINNSFGSNHFAVALIRSSFVVSPESVDCLKSWIEHEVDYQGSTRQIFVAGDAVEEKTEGGDIIVATPRQVITFFPRLEIIDVGYILLIRNGNLLAGDTTGEPELYIRYNTPQVFAANNARAIELSLSFDI